MSRPDLPYLFLRLKGRITRREFWIGFVGLFLLISLGNFGLDSISGSMTAFYIALFFPFMAVFMIYCVYGKRLRDMGRSVWPLNGAVALELLIMIAVMLAFGGAEYFSAFSQFDRREVIDPEITLAIRETYTTRISDNLLTIKVILLVVPVTFTLWVGLWPSNRKNQEHADPVRTQSPASDN